jgi:hypothetical protein
MPKVYRRRDNSCSKPTPSCDVRLRYNGGTFILNALSERGQQWLAAVVETDGAGPVEVGLAHLDTVVAEARRATVVMDTPWDQDDPGI